MKKLILIFFCFIFVPRLYSQDLKFIGGINYSSYSIRPEIYIDIFTHFEFNYEKSDARGFLFGAGFEFSISKNISIEIDELYLQKGCDIKFRESPDFRWNYTLNIFSIPVLLKIKPLSKPKVYILGGPEFSYILSHKENGRSITENTKIFDFGIVLGGGFEIKMSNNSLFIEGRYHTGLINIAKNDLRFESIKTNAILLILAFKI
jgi:hypothetical protein